ncbi:MAG: NUDIX domain-containing protein [Alphaproteobacteria bacterium]
MPGWTSKNDVEVIEKTVPYKGYFRLERYVIRHRLFGGAMSKPLVREIFERGHAAAVLPYDPKRDEVVLIEQFRPGAFVAGLDPWIVEVVAGIVEAGETPEGVVRREAVEEAGVTIRRLERIGMSIVSPGGSSETLTLFCGEVDASGAGGVHGVAHEGEDIRVFVSTATDAFDRLGRGEIIAAPAIMTLQWLATNRNRLRREWS